MKMENQTIGINYHYIDTRQKHMYISRTFVIHVAVM
jgi:hypothetical protein